MHKQQIEFNSSYTEPPDILVNHILNPIDMQSILKCDEKFFSSRANQQYIYEIENVLLLNEAHFWPTQHKINFLQIEKE